MGVCICGCVPALGYTVHMVSNVSPTNREYPFMGTVTISYEPLSTQSSIFVLTGTYIGSSMLPKCLQSEEVT